MKKIMDKLLELLFLMAFGPGKGIEEEIQKVYTELAALVKEARNK